MASPAGRDGMTETSLRCLVTGASRGIGAAIVDQLDAAGHRIALSARGAEGLEQVAGGLSQPHLVLPADVTDPQAPADLRAAIDRAWGGADVLVVNAGEGIAAPLGATDDQMWDSTLAVNLTAPFRFLREFVPPMVERGFGRVVVIASVAGKVGTPYISAYAAAKHGAVGLVRAVAAEVAISGVTANAVCPGFVDTPMTQRSIDAIVEKTGRTPEQARASLEKQQPIGRLITAQEVAAAVAYCVNDTGALNGQTITIDGGGVQS
jgi:NAD(P)-dependent dehydrogenase (short-subunit alcohol dehydrogenase family)